MSLTKATYSLINGACINVLDYGADPSNTAVNNTPAFQAAINAAILQGRPLYVPTGIYQISGSLVVERQSTEWDSFALFGDAQAGSGAAGDPTNNIMASRTILEYTGTAHLFEINYTTDFFESVSFKDIAVRQPNNTAAYQTGIAFLVQKNTPNYARKHNWENVNCYGFGSFIEVYRTSGSPVDAANFLGPITLDRVYTYGTLRGVDVNNVSLNLFVVTRSLFHGCTQGGIWGRPSSLMNLMLRDTHFESCSPAVQPGQFETNIAYDNVSAENCGTTTGFGLIGYTGQSTVGTLQVSFLSGLYGVVLGPDEMRFDRGTLINSNWPLNAAGAFTTETPENITPVIANNATWSQSDKYTVFKTPLQTRNGRLGVRPFKYLGGFNTSLGYGVSPISSGIPQAFRPNTVGTNANRVFANQGASAETFTAPVDGYIYASFAADVTDVDGVFFPSGTQITIDGVDQPFMSTRQLPSGPGIYTVMYKLNSGQVLSNFRIELTTSSWRTPMLVTFEPALLNAAEAASVLQRVKVDSYSIASAGSQIVTDIGQSSASYAVRVRMTFNGGSSGVFEYLVYGNGLNAGRTYVTSINSVAAGVGITNSNNLNVDLFYITVANTTGATLTMDVETEYLT